MKANELRIGNVLKHKSGEFFKITGSDLSLLDIKEDISAILPIEITEKILLNCGFVLMNQWFDYELALFRIGYITNDEYFQFESNGKVIDIKSLHQLQNIVYFNSEQELDVSKIL